MIITEADFTDGSSLRVALSEEITRSNLQYKIGLCWLNLASKLKSGGASKIFVASDSVNGFQHFNGKALIGSFKHTNNRSHFFVKVHLHRFLANLKT